jgi:hypothetical protein
LFKTKNDLSEATRVKAVELLNARLECMIFGHPHCQISVAHWVAAWQCGSAPLAFWVGTRRGIDTYMSQLPSILAQ